MSSTGTRLACCQLRPVLCLDNGLIEEDHVAPDSAKVGPAAAQIARRFPAADVSLYLNTLLYQDPETWSALRGVPELQA